MKKEERAVTKQEMSELLASPLLIKMYLAPVIANIAYGLMFDVNNAIEVCAGNLKGRKIKLQYELKRDFNNMRADAKRFEHSALCTSDTYTKAFMSEGDKHKDYDQIQGQTAFIQIFEAYVRKLLNILMTASAGQTKLYEKVWSFLMSIEHTEYIDYEEPDFEFLIGATKEVKTEKDENKEKTDKQ